MKPYIKGYHYQLVLQMNINVCWGQLKTEKSIFLKTMKNQVTAFIHWTADMSGDPQGPWSDLSMWLSSRRFPTNPRGSITLFQFAQG
jgi:hypothetical protein